jgi:hypothetical protein
MAQALATALLTLVLASMAATDPSTPAQPSEDTAATEASAEVVVAAGPRIALGEVPWCSNADDPRCSRDERGATGGGGDTPTRVTVDGVEDGRVAVDGEPQAWSSAPGLAPSAGFSLRVERPPR